MTFHTRAKKQKDGIVQIATRLGVSPSTVSRALRQETAHLVSAARRKEILDLADRLRFSPNPGARILRQGLNPTLTVVVPLDENIFFSEFYGRFLSGSLDRKSTRLNSSHLGISYAVFCLKKNRLFHSAGLAFQIHPAVWQTVSDEATR